MRYKVVSLDFDHTLTDGVTAIEHYAAAVGRLDLVRVAEAEFRAGTLTTREFSDRTAHIFAGAGRADVDAVAGRIALLSGVDELVRELTSRGLVVVVNSVGYRALLHTFQRRTGCRDVSGVDLVLDGDTYTGAVERYFALEDKIAFAANAAGSIGCSLEEVVAVGDGLSDMQLFAAVGRSIAFNADPVTKASADVSVDGGDVSPLRTALLDEIFGKVEA
ncbi:HAD family hydrolase [Salinarimonas ramus]|uniref:phosphoserine phosphatase n=1 Tax=Salinarimonas ramus TaxID=690164 RepID=A0A917V2J5_9HYPH|nr:HAD-IB family phosphatase [Salinarimonas ramus]GGK22278.1 hypothetical protein GCM10011322_06190 [Salinarimonas ramus]